METAGGERPLAPGPAGVWDPPGEDAASRPRPRLAGLVARYGLAVAAVVLAVLVRAVLVRTLGPGSYLFLFAFAVIAAAWRGGFGPGLLAVALGAAAAPFLLAGSIRDTPPTAAAYWLREGAFLAEGLAICLMAYYLHRARRRAQRERAQLALITDALPVLISFVGADQRYRFTSRAYETWFGLPRAEVTGRHLRDVLGAAAYEVIRPHVERALAGEEVSFEAVVPFQHGGERQVAASYVPHRLPDGRVAGYFAMVADVTRERRTEAALSEANRRAAEILESIEEGFFSVDRKWRFTYINRKFEQIAGTSGELGRTLWESYPTIAGTEFERELRRAMEERTSVEFEAAGALSGRWYRVRAYPSPEGLSVLGTDISGTRRAEEEARAATGEASRRAEQLQGLAEAAMAVNATLSVEEALQVVTERAREIIGAHQGVTSLTMDGDRAQAVTATSLSDKYAEYRGLPPAPLGEGIYGLVCRTNRPLRLTEAELLAHPVFQGPGGEAARQPPLRGWLAAPLVFRDGRNVGVLQLSDRSKGEFSASDEAILVQLAQMASVAVENAQFVRAAQEARAQAEAANRMKDQFLATLSHELRTPLHAILGWAQLLRARRGGDPELERPLETIERNARAQATLIDDLLDVSRIIAGKLALELHPVHLPDVVTAALESARPAAEARGVALRFRIEPPVEIVRGDPARLQQVVWNLLSNAVKFTPRGGEVEVRLRRVDGRAEIAVTDTGQGIRPEFLPHVFDLFRQADASTTRQQGGLGLGLSIVRQLVELHGGRVAAASPGEGRGSTFTVSLPVLALPGENRLEAAPEAGEAAALPALALSGVQVLAVDDEADARDLLASILGERGAEVRLAESVGQALALLAERRPDVLVSDIGMPEEDGFELIRRVRQGEPATRDVPAVALTAFARTEDRRQALAAGFQVHVAKPVDPAELAAVVARLAGRGGP